MYLEFPQNTEVFLVLVYFVFSREIQFSYHLLWVY